MLKTDSSMIAIDWKLPIYIYVIYTLCACLFNYLFFVPGSITLQAIFVLLLPYLGISFALFLFRRRPLFLDYKDRNFSIESISFLSSCVAKIVPITLALQISTWIFIWFNTPLMANAKEFFMYLRNSSIAMKSIVPVWLSYPNGLCFASFCLAYSYYRYLNSRRTTIFLSLSILSVFLNDLQTSGRAGMVFILFIFMISSVWDWRVNQINPLPMILSISAISIFTQVPKVLREGYQSIPEFYNLFREILRYCFSYLNTLSELLDRLPDPNWIGSRTLLPVFNLLSRVSPFWERSAIHSIERSQVWGYNNYTIAGDFLRDFSYVGCFLVPFLITFVLVKLASISSRPFNVSISIFFVGWLVFGVITNILMMGGFFVSLVFLIAISRLESIRLENISV